ncbi:hypothetical protein, partial [Mycolicibacterium hodleri]|uniref:hypothetical protein n=1 Tax=Mycolicibacterium hodleri TaxID=49897 RepID=UPI001C8F1271
MQLAMFGAADGLPPHDATTGSGTGRSSARHPGGVDVRASCANTPTRRVTSPTMTRQFAADSAVDGVCA